MGVCWFGCCWLVGLLVVWIGKWVGDWLVG